MSDRWRMGRPVPAPPPADHLPPRLATENWFVEVVRNALRNAEVGRAQAAAESERIALAGATTALTYLLAAATNAAEGR